MSSDKATLTENDFMDIYRDMTKNEESIFMLIPYEVIAVGSSILHAADIDHCSFDTLARRMFAEMLTKYLEMSVIAPKN